MKRLFFFLIFISCAGAARGQAGIQLGWNVAGQRFTYDGKAESRSAKMGLNAGIVYRFWSMSRVVMEPSLIFTRKGARDNDPVPRFQTTVFNNDYEQIRMDYLQASLPILYRQPLTIFTDATIGGGPFVSYLTGAKQRIGLVNGSEASVFPRVGSREEDHIRRLDAGLRFAGGLHVGRWNLSLTYDLGLANISPREGEKVRTRTFGLNLVLYF